VLFLIIEMEITLSLTIGVMALLIVVLIYLVVISSRKIAVYEGWIIRFRREIAKVRHRLRLVDSQNLFEKDDDVGFVFSEIVRVIDEFDKGIQ